MCSREVLSLPHKAERANRRRVCLLGFYFSRTRKRKRHTLHFQQCTGMKSRLESDTPSFNGFHLLGEGMGRLLSFSSVPLFFLSFLSLSFFSARSPVA